MDKLTLTDGQLRIQLPFARRIPRNMPPDAYIVGASQELRDQYVRELIDGIHTLTQNVARELDGVYIAGPCVQLVSAKQIAVILDAVRQDFRLCPDATVLVDVFPGKLMPADVPLYLEAGVTKMLVNAYSTQGREMKALAPGFEAGDVRNTVQMLSQKDFTNYGLRLCYGLPGQTETSLELSLSDAYFFGPAFVQIERFAMQEGSALAQEYQAALEGGAAPQFHLPNDEACGAMHDQCQRFWARYNIPMNIPML